jgi:hypothetical protein
VSENPSTVETSGEENFLNGDIEINFYSTGVGASEASTVSMIFHKSASPERTAVAESTPNESTPQEEDNWESDQAATIDVGGPDKMVKTDRYYLKEICSPIGCPTLPRIGAS